MYLSAERIAVVNRVVRETFAQSSIAWRAIPQWDTGDPGQTWVRNDVVGSPGFLELVSYSEQFPVTLVQAGAPTPDSLLATVIAKTVALAKTVDDAVVDELLVAPTPAPGDIALGAENIPDVLDALIDARAAVENKGYLAPSCIITNTTGLKVLSQLTEGFPVTESLLSASNMNSLQRAQRLDELYPAAARVLVLARRQRIAHGGAAEASPGEEPVDLAVSVYPGLEVLGETDDGQLQLAVRIRFVTRVKDVDGVVGVVVT